MSALRSPHNHMMHKSIKQAITHEKHGKILHDGSMYSLCVVEFALAIVYLCMSIGGF